MSSAVVEKNFVWRFIDKVTQGVKEARNAMQEAEEAAKQTSNEVSEKSNKWTNYGNKAKESAEKASNSYKEYKDQVTSSTTAIKAVSYTHLLIRWSIDIIRMADCPRLTHQLITLYLTVKSHYSLNVFR